MSVSAILVVGIPIELGLRSQAISRLRQIWKLFREIR